MTKTLLAAGQEFINTRKTVRTQSKISNQITLNTREDYLNKTNETESHLINLCQKIIDIQSQHITKKNDLVSRKIAAEFLGVKENTLAVWATNNRYNIPYVKVGRLVKYRIRDLEAFLEQNLKLSN
jgi:hypothetical protein